MRERRPAVGVTDAPDCFTAWWHDTYSTPAPVPVDIADPSGLPSLEGAEVWALIRAPHPGLSRMSVVRAMAAARVVHLLIGRGLGSDAGLDALLATLEGGGLAAAAVAWSEHDELILLELLLERDVDDLVHAAAVLRLAQLTIDQTPRLAPRPRVAFAATAGTWVTGLRESARIEGRWVRDEGYSHRAAPDVIALDGDADPAVHPVVLRARGAGIPVVGLGSVSPNAVAVDVQDDGLEPVVAAGLALGIPGSGPDVDPERGYAQRLLLAAARGEPVTTARLPGDARRLLGERLSDALVQRGDEDLENPLHRARRGGRLRRIARTEHGVAERWRRIAAMLDGRIVTTPPVSVTVVVWPSRATDAGRLVAAARAQSHPEVEVVLADPSGLSTRGDAAPEGAMPDTTIAVDGLAAHETLMRALDAASGEVVTVFTSGWYGSGLVTDLLLAREDAGATVTGKAPGFAYDETTDRTLHVEGVRGYGAAPDPGAAMIARDDLLATGRWRLVPDPLRALLHDVERLGGNVFVDHEFARMAGSPQASAGHGARPARSFDGLRLDLADVSES